VTGHFAVSV
jgi:hypothetical protein